jgi:hypothetical protein
MISGKFCQRKVARQKMKPHFASALLHCNSIKLVLQVVDVKRFVTGFVE